MTHHPEDAEDLVQNAWLNLCRRYGGVASCGVLFTTVRNLFIDQYRRRRIVAFVSLDKEEPPVLPTVAAREPCVNSDLDQMLAVLRPNEREMLFLYYYHGQSTKEIARTTGRPRGTVLSLIRRAIAKLRVAADGASRSFAAVHGLLSSPSSCEAKYKAASL
jgi:RNA polymerase sigma factor (sigma-70 family)